MARGERQPLLASCHMARHNWAMAKTVPARKRKTRQPVPAAPTEPPPARLLSPRRKTTTATTLNALAIEQLQHFRIDPRSAVGQPLLRLAEKLYGSHGDIMELWGATTRELATLPRTDRLALFNAKKFLSFFF